jgi:hypothetical protein
MIIILIILNLVYLLIIKPWIILITSHIGSNVIILFLAVTKLTGCEPTLVLVEWLVHPLFHEVILQFLAVVSQFLWMDCVVVWSLLEVVKLFQVLLIVVLLLLHLAFFLSKLLLTFHLNFFFFFFQMLGQFLISTL